MAPVKDVLGTTKPLLSTTNGLGVDKVHCRRWQTAGFRRKNRRGQDIRRSKVYRCCLSLSVKSQRLCDIYINSETGVLPASDNQRKRGGCDYGRSRWPAQGGYAARLACGNFLSPHTIGNSRI